MKKKIGIFVIILAIAGTVGCGGGKLTEAHKTIAEDYAKIVLPQDQDSYQFDQALEAVGEYLRNPDSEALEHALRVLKESAAYFSEALDEDQKTEELGEKLKKDLEACNVTVEDYKISGEFRNSALTVYLNYLESLSNYLELEKTEAADRTTLQKLYESDKRIQEVLRKDGFYSMNYLFTEWEKKPIEYLQKHIIDKMKSYSMGGEKWELDKQVVEDKLAACQSQLEEEISKLSAYMGNLQEKMNQLESELEELEKEKKELMLG